MRTEPSFSSLDSDDTVLDSAVQSHVNQFEPFDSDDDSSILADYRKRYGVSVDPFADDHHFPFYTGAQRRNILDQLLHFCQFGNNLLVVLGEYSLGKTRIAQALIDNLDESDDICFIEGQIDSTFDSLLSSIYEQFELADTEAFDAFASKDASPEGVAVIIIDNAHHIEDADLSHLISFLYSDAATRIHIVLMAEPHLLPRLEKMDVADVGITDFLLEKLSLSEATDYLNFRMEMADYLGPEIFTEAKVEPWWRSADGQLESLHAAAQQELLRVVTPPRKMEFNKKSLPVPHIVGASVLVGLLLMGGLYWGGGSSPEGQVNKIDVAVPIAKINEPGKIEQIAPPAVTTHAASQGAVIPVPASEITSSVAVAQQSNEAPSKVEASSIQHSKASEAAVIKQSVVPLVQTQSLQETKVAGSKVSKSLSVSSVRDTKRIETIKEERPVVSEKPIKPSIEKAVTPNTNAGFSDQEKAILGWNESEFTLQLVGLSSEKAVREFIATQPNKKDLMMFKSIRQGKDWFVVVTGRFSSSAKARKAIESLPESQKKATPWPRELRVIQKEIRQQN